jgi:pyruvate/2-oxoglutarate dehydrogenase complex dihydrolipoamide acyltransferase (E2) component
MVSKSVSLRGSRRKRGREPQRKRIMAEVEVLVAGRYNDERGRADDYEPGDILVTKPWYATSLVESGYVQRRTVRRRVRQRVDEVLAVATKPLPVPSIARHDVRRPVERREPLDIPEIIPTETGWGDEPTTPVVGPSIEPPFEEEQPQMGGIVADTPEDGISLLSRDPEVATKDLPVAVKINASPTAKKLAAKHNINLRGWEGSGKDGRVVKDDVDRYLEGR